MAESADRDSAHEDGTDDTGAETKVVTLTSDMHAELSEKLEIGRPKRATTVDNSSTRVSRTMKPESISKISELYHGGTRERHRSLASLEAKNIMPEGTGTRGISAKLAEQRRELKKSLTKDKLEALLSDRPDPDEVKPIMTEAKDDAEAKEPAQTPSDPPEEPKTEPVSIVVDNVPTTQADVTPSSEEKTGQTPMVVEDDCSLLDLPIPVRQRVPSIRETGKGVDGLLELARLLQERVLLLQFNEKELKRTNALLSREIDILKRSTDDFSADSVATLGRELKRVHDTSYNDVDIHTKSFKSGWVDKRATFGRFKRRWFYLYRDRLEYYTGPTDKKPADSLYLGNCVCKLIKGKDNTQNIELSSTEANVKPWVIRADSEGATLSWLNALRNRITAIGYVITCFNNNQSPDRRLIQFLDESLSGGSGALLVRDMPLAAVSVGLLTDILVGQDFPTTTITTLDLRNSGLEEADVVNICSAIQSSQAHCIQVVNLSHNAIGGGEAAFAISQLVQSSQSLRELVLDDCLLGNEGVLTIANGLPEMGSLIQKLSFRNNQISETAVIALCAAISSGRDKPAPSEAKSETSYQLPEEALLSEDGRVSALQPQHSVRVLDLSHNNLTTTACQHVADLLESKTALQVLYLQEDGIDDQGACLITEAMKTNASVRVLDLSLNPLHTKAASALASMIQNNEVLEFLAFLGHKLSRDNLTAMRLVGKHGLAPRATA